MSARTSTGAGRTIKRAPIKLLDAESRQDAYYLVRQWHHYFGVEYESNWLPNPPAALVGWSEDEGHHGVVAHHENVRVAGAMASLVSGEAAENAIGPAPIDERALAGDNGAVYIWLIAVDSTWRERGLGTKLLSNVLEWARDSTDAETVVAHSWQRENHPSSAGLFDRAGFEKIVELPNHYETSGRDICPDCDIWTADKKACQCDAILYAKDVERECD